MFKIRALQIWNFAEDGGKLSVESLVLDANGSGSAVSLADGDLVFFQNGSMTDASSLGSMTSPPQRLAKADSQGWDLWEKMAAGRPEFGNPAARTAVNLTTSGHP